MLFKVLVIKDGEIVRSEEVTGKTFILAVSNWNQRADIERKLPIDRADLINPDGSGGSFEVEGTTYTFQRVS